MVSGIPGGEAASSGMLMESFPDGDFRTIMTLVKVSAIAGVIRSRI